MMEKKLTGAELIAQERQRQIEVEGWTSEHDNEHDHGELAIAAAIYATAHTDAHVTNPGFESAWPFEKTWYKPGKDHVKRLVKAGALIAAEIDRLKNIDDANK